MITYFPIFFTHFFPFFFDKVLSIRKNEELIRLFSKYGLVIVKQSWEDNARNKNSDDGPCSSNLGVIVGRKLIPIIRKPTFEDLTWVKSKKKV